MNAFAIQLINGCLPSDIEEENHNSFQYLQQHQALETFVEPSSKLTLWKLRSIYRVGELSMGKDGTGYVEATFKEQKDLLIAPEALGGATHGDHVVVKRILARRGRPSAKVIKVITKAHHFTIAYTHRDEQNNFILLDIRTGEPTHAVMPGMDLKAFKVGTLLKVNSENEEVIEVLGNLDDPKVDEKLSLALYQREDSFPPHCIEDAQHIEQEVDKAAHPTRVDLTHLDFCTIDPVTAKDFDDAIYFDRERYTLYVAIADVSHYVPYFTPIDREAKKRGFTTYFPHKSFPMLPRALSENICSLKPQVDRLAFVAKIQLDKTTLKPLEETFFEAIIHSKHRFNYEEVDRLIETKGEQTTGTIKTLLGYLLPLYSITQKLHTTRLMQGFDFQSEEIKLTLDANHLLKTTQIETATPSHSLIEECMLLANQAAAKRFSGEADSIFRIHEPPELSRLEKLLTELATIGLFVESYEDSPSLIRAIQQEASRLGLASEVDTLLIKSLRQASYRADNVGHFGLGFKHYAHFTSPIRRYADLILHRLIKTQLKEEQEEAHYLLRNIEPLCARVSELEREATKAEWDFRDRKLARWAKAHQDECFEAEVIEIEAEEAKAILYAEIQGVVVKLRAENLMLFDRISLRITDVNIAQATLFATVVKKLDPEAMELR